MPVLSDIPFKLELAPLLEQLHLEPGSEDAAELEKLMRQCQAAGRPKAIYRECYVDAKGADSVTIDGTVFTSRVLRMNMEKAERAFPFVVTCGTEFDGVELPPGDFFRQFWLDTIKAAALFAAIKRLDEHLNREFAPGKTTSMSPGSGDADVWPIEQQRQLFALLGDVKKQIGVELTDSFLMIPNKTISGIRFPREIDFHTCQLCHRKVCPSRSAPFDRNLWEATQNKG